MKINFSFSINNTNENPKNILEQDGSWGQFSVSNIDNNGNDIAKASALQYHEIDIDPGKDFYKKFVFLRKRVGKSKFAKKTIEDTEDDEEDPEVDEATGEGSAYNDSKYQRMIRAHLIRLAQNSSLRANLFSKK